MFKALRRKAVIAVGIGLLAAGTGLHAASPYTKWSLGDGTATGKWWWSHEQSLDFSAVAPPGHSDPYEVISPETTTDPLKKNLRAYSINYSHNGTAGHCFELETFSDGNTNADTRFWIHYIDRNSQTFKWKSLDNNTGTGNFSKARLYTKGGEVWGTDIYISAANGNHNNVQFKFKVRRIDGTAGSESGCTTGQTLPWMKIITAGPDGGMPVFSSNAN